jgi:hypothetical protein
MALPSDPSRDSVYAFFKCVLGPGNQLGPFYLFGLLSYRSWR